MNIKPQPNHQLYLEIIRSMTPAQRLQKAFELSAFSKKLFLDGLKKNYPNLSEKEFQEVMLKHLQKCYNQNY